MENNEYPKILFPYDFSTESDNAIPYLVSLAKMFNYSIEILNILDPGTKKYMWEHKLSKQQLIEKVGELARDFQEKYNIPTTYLLKNAPIKRIRKISEKEKVTFTFLAINEPASLGSTIMKVVSTSPVPVFVVQNGVNYKPFKKILFRLDDTFNSRQKAGWVLRFAKKTRATVHIFSVNPVMIKDRVKAQKQHTIIESVEKFFEKSNVGHITVLAPGRYEDFDDEVMKYAEKEGIDLYTVMISAKVLKNMRQADFRFIFNKANIPALCVNTRDLFLGGGIS